MTIPFHPDAVIPAGGHRYRIVDADVPHRLQVWRCDLCGHTVNPNAPYVPCRSAPDEVNEAEK